MSDDSSKRVTGKVVDWIRAYIADQGLGCGDRLPSEHRIGQLTGASRASVREALHGLVGRGIIEARPGKGYYLTETEHAPTAEPGQPALGIDEIRDLTEARLVIECACAALAAVRATPADVARLEGLLEAMEAQAAVAPTVYRETIEVHLMIADASHNRTLREMLALIVPRLAAHGARLSVEIPDRARLDVALHKELWSSIRAGDPKAARAAMERHIRDAASLYLLTYESRLVGAEGGSHGGLEALGQG
jgi:GntR family transcriptional repressor for pyruvate dehydrogenase complex